MTLEHFDLLIKYIDYKTAGTSNHADFVAMEKLKKTLRKSIKKSMKAKSNESTKTQEA